MVVQLSVVEHWQLKPERSPELNLTYLKNFFTSSIPFTYHADRKHIICAVQYVHIEDCEGWQLHWKHMICAVQYVHIEDCEGWRLHWKHMICAVQYVRIEDCEGWCLSDGRTSV